MKANEFVKKFGIDEAKRVVEYRDKHASRTHVYKFNKSCADKAKLSGGAYLYTESYNEWSVSVDELKRLVKSHDLIKSYKGCGKPKETALETAKFTLKHFESTRGLEVELFGNNNRELELKQAIADVESCQ